MLTTRFTELAGCRLPLQQAGMGGITTVDLGVAVSDAGGLGMVGAGGLPTDDVRARLDEATRRTSAPVGVNFLMPFVDAGAVEEAGRRARVVEFFYGAPDPGLVNRAKANGALACWQIGSADEARRARDAGCDLVVAQGVEAGGHVRGTVGLLPLLDDVLDAVGDDTPVIAAGGIGTARAVKAVLAAGADAARVGTRFVATHEADAHPDYSQALVDAGPEDTVLTTAFGVMWPDAPHRVLRSCVEAAESFQGDIVGEVDMGDARMPLPPFAVPCPGRGATGTVAAMALYAGQSVGAVRKVQSAADVVAELTADLADL